MYCFTEKINSILKQHINLTWDKLLITNYNVIYNDRIHNLELNTVMSLGRLFFGKKYNPLRNRIDSVHLTNSEMFLSSIGFTISLFLIPTTMVYYIVFLLVSLQFNLSWSQQKLVKPVKSVIANKLFLFQNYSARYESQCYWWVSCCPSSSNF